MINSFVLEVVNSFSVSEEKDFETFMNSPYFNAGTSSKQLTALASHILSAKKQGMLEALDNESLYNKLFPNTGLVENKIDKLMSAMKRLLQDFLSAQHFFHPEKEKERMLAAATELRLKGLENKYLLAINKLTKSVDSSPWETISNYFFRHLLALEEHEWHSTFNKAKGDVHIPETIRHLDNYYWSQKTEMLNRLLLQQKMIILPDQAKEIIELPWEIPAAQLVNNSLMQLIWKIHKLLKDNQPNPESFFHLMNVLQSQESKISPEDNVKYYTYLRNICILVLDEGREELRPVLFQIQKDNLQRGYFYFDGKIPPNSFLSITQTALSVGEINWAFQFVEAHKEMIIGENELGEFYDLNRAICLFAEKKYHDALEIIPFGSSYSMYHLLARRLELKIYYELDDDLLPYKIDAFKMFISRAGNKVLSKNLHELYVNFINFLRQLSLSPKARDKKRAEKMIERINKKKLVADRAWLLEKARELGERKT